MKLTIAKDGPHIRVEIVADAAKKPIVLELRENDLGGLLLAVEAIRKADKAKISIEL